MNRPFPSIRFKGTLRPSQAQVIEIARQQLADGERRLHVIAPPGTGKTVLGLYLWAEVVRQPALVLSPNSAIQAQWKAQTRLFEGEPGSGEQVSTDPEEPGLLTSLTYQAVTLPRRGGEDLDGQARAAWCDALIEKEQADGPVEARIWIDDLAHHNRAYYEERLAVYRKKVRDRAAASGQALDTLHASSRATLDRLAGHGIGVIILDECHHLMGHWGRVLADARGLFDGPIVIGLTATPPDPRGQQPPDIERYENLLGPVDFEVPVPAVVKDGFLAPYQDLAYFVRPTADELTFIANADKELRAIVEDLCRPETDSAWRASSRETLPDWLARVMTDKLLPTGKVRDWSKFAAKDPQLALSGRLFLLSRGRPLPADVPMPDARVDPEGRDELPILVPVLDRYVRHRLRRSDDPQDHALAEQVTRRLRYLGVQITETGPRACASPVGRVLAYSRAKNDAMLEILQAEGCVLGDRLRAVVIADYEKTSATSPETEHLLDEEAGGAIAAFRKLLTEPETDALDPILVTGSSVLVDDDLAPRFERAAVEWLDQSGFEVELHFADEAGFRVLQGRGGDWCPRVYVGMITHFFQEGLTRCLVGTRGLLGEGWDASKVNVLVDLTTVTTSTSVNQLRGRSIRLDPDDPTKLADNWDVVCLAPEFTKGLDDYHRFIAKHKTLFGLTDDGEIEKGVGHVHAAFTELRPEQVEGSVGLFNAEMLERVGRKAAFRAQWRIGEPFEHLSAHAVELRPTGSVGPADFPPFADSTDPWSASSLTLSIARAILGGLEEAGLLHRGATLRLTERGGGYVRAFLRDATEANGRLFARALHEAMGRFDNPRYVMPRYVDEVHDNWLSELLPEILARYCRRRKRRFAMLHAVPTPLARNQKMAAIYGRHWNLHVSPGEPVYGRSEEGEALIEQASREGWFPRYDLHDKEIFS